MVAMPTRESAFAEPDGDDPTELAKNDPLATQVWRMYAKQRDHLPNAARMENLTWRLMSLTLRRQRDQTDSSSANPLPEPSATPQLPSVTTNAAGATNENDVPSSSFSQLRSRSPAETRRGRTQTVRPLEEGASIFSSSSTQNLRQALASRSRSRSLSMMDIDRSSLHRSRSRNRTLYEPNFTMHSSTALDSLLEDPSSFPIASLSADHFDSNPVDVDTKASIDPLANSNANLLEQLYTPIAPSGNEKEAFSSHFGTTLPTQANLAALTSATSSSQGTHANGKASAPASRRSYTTSITTPLAAVTSPSSDGQPQANDQLRQSFEKAAFDDLFGEEESHAWKAASPLEEHAQYVMSVSVRRTQLPGDRDDQFLASAQATHLDSVPGIDDYVTHQANQHPEYGFLPRLVRKTSFDHKVRERSESRGARHRNPLQEPPPPPPPASDRNRGNARKRPFRDASPMPFGLRNNVTADQRMASGLSREIPPLFPSDMMQYMPTTLFDFDVQPQAHDMGHMQLASSSNPAELAARTNSMPTVPLVDDLKANESVNVNLNTFASNSTPHTPASHGLYHNDNPDFNEANKGGMTYPIMYFPPDSHPLLQQPMQNGNLSPSFLHVDPGQLLSQNGMQTTKPTAQGNSQLAHPTSNLSTFHPETGFDPAISNSYGFVENSHIPPGALELNPALTTSRNHSLAGGQPPESFYTSVFQSVDMAGQAGWTQNTQSASPLPDPSPTLSNSIAPSSYSETSDRPLSYAQTPSPQKGSAPLTPPGIQGNSVPNPTNFAASSANVNTSETNTTPIVCSNCQTTKTPLWRRDSEGNALCNACGLFQRLHGVMRPLSLKTDVIKKRNRNGAASTRDSGRSRQGQRRSSGSGASRTPFRNPSESKPEESFNSASSSNPATPMRSPPRLEQTQNFAPSLDYPGW